MVYAVPLIGLIHIEWEGSKIKEWLDDNTMENVGMVEVGITGMGFTIPRLGILLTLP